MPSHRRKPGGPGLAMQAWAPIAREAALQLLLIEACKGFEIL